MGLNVSLVRDGKYESIFRLVEKLIKTRMKNPTSENQMSLFSTPREQGAREWSTFNVIKHDRVGAFRVLTPRKHETPRYPNILHISRLPRRLTPKFSS